MTTTTARSPRSIRSSIFSGGLLLAALLILCFGDLPRWSGATAATAATLETETPPLPTPEDLGMALALAGLTPENLAAAGVTPQQTTEIVAVFGGRLAASEPPFIESNAAYLAAKTNYERLHRLMQGGRARGEQPAEYAAAEAAMTEAAGQRSAAIGEARETALTGLDEGVVLTLNRLRANASVAVPTQYKVLGLDPITDQADWAHLRDALSQQRYCDKHNLNLDDGNQGVITALASDEAIGVAEENLAENLGGVRAAWDTAVAAFAD